MLFLSFLGSGMRVVIGVATTLIRCLLYAQSYKQKRPIFRAMGVFLGYKNSPYGSRGCVFYSFPSPNGTKKEVKGTIWTFCFFIFWRAFLCFYSLFIGFFALFYLLFILDILFYPLYLILKMQSRFTKYTRKYLCP